MKKLILFLCMIFISSAGYCADLAEELAFAYNNNPELKSYREYLKIKDEGVSAAMSGLRPNISATSNINRLIGLDNNQNLTGNAYKDRNTMTNSISLTQPVFTGFKTSSELKTAKNAVLGARSSLNYKEQEVMLQAAAAYFDVGRDMAVLELNQNNEKVMLKHFNAAKQRLEVGDLTITDVSQSEARYEQAKSETIKAKGDLMISTAAYEKVIGRSPNGIENINASLYDLLPDNLDKVLNEALKSSPLLKTAEYNYRQAKSEVGVARSSLLPTLDIVTSFEDEKDVAAKGLDTSGGTVGAVLKFPLYSKGLARSNLRAAKYQAGQSLIDIDVTKNGIKEYAKQAWESYNSTSARLMSIESQIKASKLALEGVKKESELGTRTLLDVLDAEQEYLNAMVSLIKAKRDKAVAMFEVLHSMGKLTVANIKLPTKKYNPIEHYKNTKWKWLDTSVN